ncbi:MAG: hypothetical protein QOH15_2052, partial [Gaiellales bacterium]|nr:hypothetical protein [Gaiellales bacterium]
WDARYGGMSVAFSDVVELAAE